MNTREIIIQIEEDASECIKKVAIELTPIVTLFSEGVNYPIIRNKCEYKDGTTVLELVSDTSTGILAIDKGYKISVYENDSIDELIKMILVNIFNTKDVNCEFETNLNINENIDLESLYGDGFLKQRDKNHVLQGNRYKIFVREDLTFENVQVIGAMASRIALDTQSISYPICGNEDSNILVQEGVGNLISIVDGKIIATYNKEDINGFYKALEIKDLKRLGDYLNNSINLKNFDGQYAYALGVGEEEDEFYLDNVSEERLNLLPKSNFYLASYKDEIKVFEDEKEFNWEVDTFLDNINLQLAKVDKNKKIKIEAALSEDFNVRNKIKEKLMLNFVSKGIDAEVNIYNSFKQGFSWIADGVIPKLKKSRLAPSRIVIKFSEFVKDHSEEWTSENGAVPSYVNMNLDNKGKWFELPTRLLQELYPIDDVLSKELSLDRDNITFEIIKDSVEDKYEVEIYGEDNSLKKYEYSPVFSERYYLDEFPTMGLVHPGTGYFKIYEDGKLTRFQKQSTDLENIWDYYQNTILPKANEYFKEFHSPIFSTLKMEMGISESDEKLPYRQDLMSALDSFHEDLYFVGLDYFKLISDRKFGKVMDAPGLILPIIHKEETSPNISWSINLPAGHKPFFIRDGVKTLIEEKNSVVTLSGVEYKEFQLKLFYDVNFEFDKNINYLKEIIESGNSAMPKIYEEVDEIILRDIKDVELSIILPKSKQNKNLSDLNVKKDEIYNYEKYIETIKTIEKIEGIDVDLLTESYKGRDLHLIEIKNDDDIFSTSYKKTNMKPTVYINARHHANEVSSTNSTFELVKLLKEDKDFVEISKNINVVLLPMENPDGVQIHYELQKEHSDWIYHISRFNSLGKEFSQDYFLESSIHTEAKALPMVYEKWLPDVYIDDHGVPHHEWCQQFSGYTAPAYKGFWIPRALLYGYFWYREGFQSNVEFAKELQEVIAQSFREDETSKSLNEDLKDRFEKYANKWLPKMFPADYYKDLIFYWVPFDEKSTKKHLSVMFPEVTVIGYTSEVIDETANGEFLESCVDAHLRNNIAILKHINEKNYVFEKTVEILKDGFRIKNIRKR